MKSLLIITILFMSCSTLHKTGYYTIKKIKCDNMIIFKKVRGKYTVFPDTLKSGTRIFIEMGNKHRFNQIFKVI